MIRKIEFRVWDSINKKFDYTSKEIFLTLDGRIHFWSGDNVIIESKVWPEYLILQQFTGLKDKNDKKVFEGDIVKCWKSDCHYLENGDFVIGEVKWDEDYAGFYVVYKGKVDDDLVSNTDCEVIGNIFENLN